MPHLDLDAALLRIGELLATPEGLIRVVAGGRRRGADTPEPEQLRGRVVTIKDRPNLQLVGTTGPRVSTVNLAYGTDGFADGLRAVLARPYASWRVETTEATWQLRVTKKGRALLHDGPPVASSTAPQAHDRTRQRMIDPDDPLFTVLGADAAKRRQVDAFLRSLDTALDRAEKRKSLPDGPLRMVDLGCGNAYLTMAAHRYLSDRRPGSRTVGVELRADLVERSRARAGEADLSGLDFVPGTIAAAQVEPADVVLALHACDTATDEALARGLGWSAPVLLAAPCCHHDVQRQLEASGVRPPGTASVLSSPILRERFADVLTDAVRAAVLRTRGYRVEVVEFVESAHTPRNVLLRAVRAGEADVSGRAAAELAELLETWRLRPALLELLD